MLILNCKLITKHTLYNCKFDYHSYLWFRYHRLFFCSLIQRGRKLWAFKFFGDVKYKIKSIEKGDPFLIFTAAMVKITPGVLLTPYKLGGMVYGVPIPISERKQYTFAVNELLKH